jgi:hypothetical protein
MMDVTGIFLMASRHKHCTPTTAQITKDLDLAGELIKTQKRLITTKAFKASSRILHTCT